MLVGTILLDLNDKYIDCDNALPVRPDFDKELLKSVVSKGFVSMRGLAILPPSIQREANYKTSEVPNIAVNISELGRADILIVSRSPKVLKGGKRFRLDKFKQIGDGNPQIYIKK